MMPPLASPLILLIPSSVAKTFKDDISKRFLVASGKKPNLSISSTLRSSN